MNRYRLNLAQKAGSESVATGSQQEFEAQTSAEAKGLYHQWLLEGGEDPEEIENRILCDLKK